MTDFLWQSTPLIAALIFMLGSCVGSFVNVVAHRLPIMDQQSTDTSQFNLAYPSSQCPFCAQAIKPWQNLPIVGYLLLRGRSHCCNQPIGVHYVLTELFTGAVSAAVFVYLVAVVGPLVGNATAFLTLLASSLGLFWWLIAILGTGHQHPVSASPLWQSLLWLGLLANLDDQYIPLLEVVGLVFATYVVGSVALGWVSHRQDRVHLLTHGLAAGVAWFGTAFLLPLALLALCIGAARLDSRVRRYANNKTSQARLLHIDQWAVAAAMLLSWLLSVSSR
jgi:prepilin signal peptidase PulO-like enzyme (type II secretory pathway)